jgi:hypothetical protein
MANKLNYATPATHPTRRSTREMMSDAIVGSGLVLVGLFVTIFLAIATEGWGWWLDEIFESPRTMVRRGAARITKGREAARNCRP